MNHQRPCESRHGFTRFAAVLLPMLIVLGCSSAQSGHAPGVAGGAPARTESMLTMRNMLPANAYWAAFGISRHEFPMVAQAALLGGHVRVGLEDNLYLGPGQLATNAQLVEKAAHILRELSFDLMTPAEARVELGLRTVH